MILWRAGIRALGHVFEHVPGVFCPAFGMLSQTSRNGGDELAGTLTFACARRLRGGGRPATRAPDLGARGPCAGAKSALRDARGSQDEIGRVDVSEPASISAGVAGRYATAVFELAQEGKGLKALEKDVDALESALSVSADLRDLINSPVYSREDQARAVAAIASRMGLSQTLASTLGLMAANRRLFVLPQLLAALRARIAEAKGEVTAEVWSAQPLTTSQSSSLAAALKETVGKDIKLKAAVDDSLIGGLVVKVGSKMIDTSIRSKLASLQNAMKEVG